MPRRSVALSLSQWRGLEEILEALASFSLSFYGVCWEQWQ
jgi:hypothetical protein